jgi:hypothetical protein
VLSVVSVPQPESESGSESESESESESGSARGRVAGGAGYFVSAHDPPWLALSPTVAVGL